MTKAEVAAVRAARDFIRNGVALGYIRMPDAGSPDPAHNTLPMLDRVLAAQESLPASDSDQAADWTDARRYRLLRDVGCNNFSLSRNEGPAINHMSVADWIKDDPCQALQDVHPAELQRMADSNSLWQLQIYPNTPIAFYVSFGHSLDTVVDEVAAILADPAKSDAQWKKANQLLEAVTAARSQKIKGA